MIEHPKRSIVKALSWRIFCFFLTISIVYAYTRNIKQSIGVGVGVDGVKLILYYIHERIWNRFHFGRQKPSDYQI